MAIERCARLHDVTIMLHSGRPGGQYTMEHVDWDTEADALIPGSGTVLPPVAIAFDIGAQGVAWATVRELLDVALLGAVNDAVARAADIEKQRDRANSERDAAMDGKARAERRADAMRAALAGKIEETQAALAADDAAMALRADVISRGT